MSVLLYAFSNPPGYLTRLASEVCDEIMLPDVLSARFEFSLLQINSSSLASLSLVHPVQGLRLHTKRSTCRSKCEVEPGV